MSQSGLSADSNDVDTLQLYLSWFLHSSEANTDTADMDEEESQQQQERVASLAPLLKQMQCTTHLDRHRRKGIEIAYFPTLPSSDFYLVSFCASVITTMAQYRHFQNLLTSMGEQIAHGNLYIFSVHLSSSLGLTNQDLSDLFQDFGAPYHILLQKRAKPRFVQYQEMLGRIPNKPNTWLLFSEEADLWSPKRIYALISLHSRIPVNTDSHPVYTILTLETCHQQPGCCDVRHPAQVDSALLCGCIKYSFDTPVKGQIQSLEHTELVVREQVLKTFIHENPFLVQHNRFVGAQFSAFAQRYRVDGHERCVMKAALGEWLYFHRHTSGEKAPEFEQQQVVDVHMSLGLPEELKTYYVRLLEYYEIEAYSRDGAEEQFLEVLKGLGDDVVLLYSKLREERTRVRQQMDAESVHGRR
ncbi:hypothetical protein BC832DRAFT_592449 [Gaertneriomyces semiglobifer]|nr:hypothetical protein BC832DRAFT_592449 [Gaertneriomyces semiglobifer]